MLNLIRSRIAASLLAVVTSLCAAAQAPAQSDAGATAKIEAVLLSRFPGTSIRQIRPSAVPGLYEVVSDSGIVYTDADAEHVFVGSIIHTSSGRDLTAERWTQLNAIEFERLPFDLAIKTVRGNGSRRFATFEDPDCPYCRKLAQEIQGMTDVTMFTFLYPIAELHADAPGKALRIWCADDRSTAWHDWMLKGVLPSSRTCSDSGLQKILDLGRELRVTGTPTLFFADGTRSAGALSRSDLERKLNDSQPK